MNASIKFPWQQFIVEAFLELHHERLQDKVNIAERAIYQRMREGPLNLEEQLALRDGLIDLQVLIPRKRREEDPGRKKNVA